MMACWPISEQPKSATGDDYTNHVALQSNEKSTWAGHINHTQPRDKESSLCHLQQSNHITHDQDYEISFTVIYYH